MNVQDTKLHNEHVPRVLRLLVEPQSRGNVKLEGTLVMTESVVLGIVLMAEHMGKSGPGVLDHIYHRVLERLEAEQRERRTWAGDR